jgi:hypothetical protein
VGNQPTGNQPAEPLAGISFRPISPANSQYLSGLISAGGLGLTSGQVGGNAAPRATAEAATSKSAPAAAPAPAADAVLSGGDSASNAAVQTIGGAYSGNVWGGLGYQYYFGFGGGEQMSLVSVQEADAAGSSGGFTEALAIVAPVVKAWAPDARLTESRSALNNEGQLNVRPMPAGADVAVSTRASMDGGSPFNAGEGWRFVYLSSSRNEMLQFVVMPDKTSILRLRWAPLDLDPARVKVGSQAAISALIKAISDKSFRGEEETSQKDYFFGHAFTQPKTGEWDNENHTTEVLYQVPSNARWNVSLQQVVGKLVWDINWYASDDGSGVSVSPGLPGSSEPGVVAGSMPGSSEPGVVEGSMPGSTEPGGAPGASEGSSGDEAVTSSEGGTASTQAAFRLRQASTIGMVPVPEPFPVPPAPCPGGARQEKNVYTNNGGQGMVDAETGTVIRFTRPTRVTHTWSNWQCDEPEVQPMERVTGAMKTPGVYILEKGNQ